MTDGENSKFDKERVLKELQDHKIPIPQEKIKISIPNARGSMENCFNFFFELKKEEFIWQPEYDEVAGWFTDNNGMGLFLYGDCGRGKSMLSRHVIPAMLLMNLNKVARVFDAREMNRKLDDILEYIHIISLDDIGTESEIIDYGNRRVAFSEIVDNSEKYGKLLIVSTNLGKKEIIEKYGERTYDRVVATMRRIEFKGKSLRK